MKNIEFNAAIFDLDGTLLDSLGIWDKIDRDFLEKRRGIKVPPDYVYAIAPLSFEQTAVYTKKRFNLPDTPLSLMREWTDMAKKEYAENILIKDGAKDYLKMQKEQGKKIALCTSCPEIFYIPALKRNGIYKMFDAFCDTDKTGKGKNEPDIYLCAADMLSEKADKCIVFEDTLSAAKSAKAAGMTVCGVYDRRIGRYNDEMKTVCDFHIGSFKELI